MNQTNECKKEEEKEECECCVCHGHEWIVLDRGETIECKHCDADITQEEIEAEYDPNY